MFLHLNDPERKVVVGAALVLITGALIHHLFERHPSWKQTISLIDRPVVSARLDLNQATQSQLEALPYIGPSTARAILQYRRDHKAFRFVDELRKIPVIRPDNLSRFRDYLEVRP